MSLSIFAEATETVRIERGNKAVEFECYLERIGAANETYAVLEAREREALEDYAANKGQLLLFGIPQYWMAQLAETDSKTNAALTQRKQEARRKELEEKKAALSKAVDDLGQTLKQVRAERIVFLTKSIKVADDPKSEPLVITVEDVMQLSPDMVANTVRQIEEAIFGPLAETPNSITS